MGNVHKQYVYKLTPEGIKAVQIYPETGVAAIADIGMALDAYKEAFLDTSYLQDTTVRGVTIVENGVAEIDLSAENISYNNTISGLNSFNVQNAIDEVDDDLRFNAIHPFDATVRSAPGNTPRDRGWHVDINEPLEFDHQYSRYFYLSSYDSELDQVGAPNINDAVAHWVIDGKHIYFEYLENGLVHTIVELTTITGEVKIPSFYPVPSKTIWFFGRNQLDEFPDNDTVRSMVNINVPVLNMMVGDTFDLSTVNKQIVGAINELNEKVGIQIHEEQSPSEALQYSIEHPNVFVYVAKGS